MRNKYSEDEGLAIRVAIETLNQCESAQCVYDRIDEFRELGIDHECVGMVAIMQLGQLGIHSSDDRYMEVERFFKFKTVQDYHRASWEEKTRWFNSPTLRIDDPVAN